MAIIYALFFDFFAQIFHKIRAQLIFLGSYNTSTFIKYLMWIETELDSRRVCLLDL